jgi:predicted ATP-dependent Lon-type protease
MSNEYLQNFDKAYIEQFLATAPNNPQALILGAYLEEKEKWENKLKTILSYKDIILDEAKKLEKKMIEGGNELNKLQIELENESGIWVSILKFFNIKTKIQRKFYNLYKESHALTIKMNKLGKEYEEVLNEYEKIYSNPPDTRQYELAMIGNTLFKSR